MSESNELDAISLPEKSDISGEVEACNQIKRENNSKTGEKPHLSDDELISYTYVSAIREAISEWQNRIPVTICVAIVLVSLKLLPYYSIVKPIHKLFHLNAVRNNHTRLSIASILTDSHHSNGSLVIDNSESLSSIGAKLVEAIIITVIVTIIVAVITAILANMVVRKCYRAIHNVSIVGYALALVFIFITYFSAVLDTLDVAFDTITAVIILWNYAFVGITAIFFAAPKLVKRVYLVIVCALLALSLNKLLPAWTTWAILIAFSLWDIYAVFCGPLKTIIDEIEAIEDELKDYEFREILDDSRFREMQDEIDSHALEHMGGLGLGDYLLYGLLVAKTYVTTNMLTAVIALIAVLIGLLFTTLCMAKFSLQAMPALPMSIFLGLCVRFTGAYFIGASF